MTIRTELLEFLLEGMIQIETEIGLSGVIRTRLHQGEMDVHIGGASHLTREPIGKVHHQVGTRKKGGNQDRMDMGGKIGAFQGRNIQSLQMVIGDKREVQAELREVQ